MSQYRLFTSKYKGTFLQPVTVKNCVSF